MSDKTLTDVPDEDVDQVVSDLESEGCTATKKQQTDGKWTVTAKCPDKSV